MQAPSALIGHEEVRRALRAAHRDAHLGHALLLTGPQGVGKTTLALDLAADLLDARGWPGGVLAHPDLWLEDSDAESVGVARIRPTPGARRDEPIALQELMSLRTYAGGMRVAIVARAERLTEVAADALLKTLEEPPPGTLVVLCAANPEALAQTVISRTVHVLLTTVPPSAVTAWLIGAGVDTGLASLAAALSGGRPGRAWRLATEPGLLDAEVGALHAFLAVAGSGADGALRAAAELTPGGGAEGRERALLLLSVWASFARDAALEASGAPELRLWAAYAPVLERWAQDLGATRLTEIVGLLLRAQADIARYAQPRLTFETLFLDVFAAALAPPAVTPPPRPAALAEAPAATASPGAAERPARRRPARRR